MTPRLYYHDAYKRHFESKVAAWTVIDQGPAVILDETYFYPSSGGQPHDTGLINGKVVREVLIRPGDGAILHILDEQFEGSGVEAEIDWKRRFDHMQQHTGQHILSQAFLRVMNAQTVSFHLGSDSSTIDLDLGALDHEGARAVEALANRVIWENRQVSISIVPREQAEEDLLRKPPPEDGETLRLVQIEDFDTSACGGTHVASTGEIGLIKIVKWERHRGSIRAEFVCGGRALDDYAAKNRVINNLAAQLTTGYQELEGSVSRQLDEISSYRSQLRKVRRQLTAYRLAEMTADAGKSARGGVFLRVLPDIDLPALRQLANQVTDRHGAVVLLASVGDETSLVFASPDEANADMGVLIKEAFDLLGSGAGGGSPTFAQGKAPAFSEDEIIQVLETIQEKLAGKES